MLVGKHSRRKIILVPRCHDDDHLSPRRETGLDRVLPLLPHLCAEGLAVGLLAVFNRVIYNDQVRGVAGDARTQTATDEPARVIAQLKLHSPVDIAYLDAEQRLPELLYLLFVAPTELLREVLVVAGNYHAVFRPSP